MSSTNIPSGASAAVLQPSDPIPEYAISVKGPNFDEPLSLQEFLYSYERIGFQANSLGKAIEVVNRMVSLLILGEFLDYDSKYFVSANGVYPMSR